MATESKDTKPSRVVAVAIDNSEYAEKAFDCEYFFYLLIKYISFGKLFQNVFHFYARNHKTVILMHTNSMRLQIDWKTNLKDWDEALETTI